MDDRIPRPWQRVLASAGMDSIGELRARIGGEPPLHVSTIMAIMRGETKRPKPDNIERMRRALNLTPTEIGGLLGRAVPPPIEMPVEFALLSRRQQDAVVSVVRAMLQPAEEEKRQRPALRSVARRPETPRQGDNPP